MRHYDFKNKTASFEFLQTPEFRLLLQSFRHLRKQYKVNVIKLNNFSRENGKLECVSLLFQSTDTDPSFRGDETPIGYKHLLLYSILHAPCPSFKLQTNLKSFLDVV